MTSPHSPLPWHVETSESGYLHLHDADGDRIARFIDKNCEADIAYALRAVSAHQALVDALQRAAVWVEHQTPNRMWSKPIEDDMRAEDVAMINAALQLAGVSEPKP